MQPDRQAEDLKRLRERLLAGRHPSSMVDSPSVLTIWLLSWLLSGVVFPRVDIERLRAAQEQGPLLIVMRSRSWLDYFYFNFAYRREGIRLARFASGLDVTWLRPFVSWLGSYLLGRRRFPEDRVCLGQTLEAGSTAVIFLDAPTSQSLAPNAEVVGQLEAAFGAQRRCEAPISVAPQLLVWDKRPEKPVRGIAAEVLGTRRSPSLIRKAAWVLRSIYESFLKLGEPTVQVAETVNLRGFAERHPGLSDAELAVLLHHTITQHMEDEERVVTGPPVKRAKELREEILSDAENREALDSLALRLGRDRDDVRREAGGILTELASDFDLLWVKAFSAVLSVVWSQIYDGFEVDDEGLAKLRQAAKTRKIVLVPSHKSHIDYLVMSNLFYRYGLMPPHIAAGINLNFWPIGGLFRGAGAFFLRRSFAGDILYEWVFKTYLVKVLKEGFPVEFFIEGTRSRTGKLNPPKYGMLNVLVEAFSEGKLEQVAFVPVSIGYEAIIEGASYKKELDGGEKRSEGLTDLLTAPKVLRARYGRVFVEFGTPFDLDAFVTRYHGPTRGQVAPEALAKTVRRLAYKLIHDINDVTTVTPGAIGALILLNNPARSLTMDEIAREAGFVCTFLTDKQARLSGVLRDAYAAHLSQIHGTDTGHQAEAFADPYDREFTGQTAAVESTTDRFGAAVREPIARALELLAGKKVVRILEQESERRFSVPDDRRVELTYYKNNILHFFVADAVFATALFESGEETVKVAQVRESAAFYSKLLKLEFCFEASDRFDEVFEESRRRFVSLGWAVDGAEGEMEITRPLHPGAEFLRALLVSTIETYWLIADVLAQSAAADEAEWLDAKTLSKTILSRGRRYYQEGRLLFPESLAASAFDNAIKIFRDSDLGVGDFLESKSEQKGRKSTKLFRVRKERLGQLRSLADRLLALKQPRTPGSVAEANATTRSVPVVSA